MTEDFNPIIPDFDNPDSLVSELDNTYSYFGELYLIAQPVIPFQTGVSFTIPGVFSWRQNEAKTAWEKQGLLDIRKAAKPVKSSKHTLYVFVMETEDKNGQPHQRALMGFGSWEDAWKNKQLPALQATRKVKDLAVSWVNKTPLYAKVVEQPSGYTFKKNEEVKNTNFWGDIIIYPDKATMVQARQEFFASLSQTNGDGTPAKNYDHFPHNWRNTPDQLIRNVQKQHAAGKNIVEIAKGLLLVGKDGRAATIDKPEKGQEGKTPADVARILAEILAPELDMPVEMLADQFKGELGL